MSAKEIVNDVVIPSSSSYVKNESWTLISQGAEARVWKIPILLEQVSSDDETQQQISNNGQSSSPPVKRTRLLEEEEKDPHVNDEEDVQQQQWMVAKERFKKSYRHAQLDERLTRQRCRMEARILEKCYNKSSSVTAGNSNDACTTTILRVPRVHRLDPPILFLEYLPGRTVRDALEVDLLPAFLLQQQQQQQAEQQAMETNSVVLLDLSQRMGRMIRHLHNLGIVHGDLTTSNMMLAPKVRKQQQQPNTSSATALPPPPPPPPIATDINYDDHDDDDDELALIDFGLAKNTESAEERAVDLYVLERALISTHPSLPARFIETLLDAYSSFGKCSSNNHDATKSSSSKTNGNSDSAKSSSSSAAAAAATLRRLEQVRQRGRKRECFG